MRFDGVIFDLDGTLWDSCESVAASWNRSLEARFGSAGCFSREDIQGIMGLTGAEIAARLFSSFGSRAAQVCALCLEEEAERLSVLGGKIYPGIEAMLKDLYPKAGLYIVSNCQRGYIESFLAFSGLGGYFSAWACEGETGLSKAENIRLLAARKGLRRPVYVGDTATDEKSAREAGCAFVHAGYGFGSAQAPDAVLLSPAELPVLLEAL